MYNFSDHYLQRVQIWHLPQFPTLIFYKVTSFILPLTFFVNRDLRRGLYPAVSYRF